MGLAEGIEDLLQSLQRGGPARPEPQRKPARDSRGSKIAVGGLRLIRGCESGIMNLMGLVWPLPRE